MFTRISFASALLSITLSGTSLAQTPTPPCDGAPWSDFDFWVGSWNVYAPDDGPYLGQNIIARTHGGCLMTESWTGASGTQGSSMNYYDPVEAGWRQVWVSPGWFLDYTGGLNDNGQMVLTGLSHTLNNGQTVPYRGTWTLNEDGSVSQFFEQQDAAGAWQPVFLGIYVNQDDDPRAAEAEEARGG